MSDERRTSPRALLLGRPALLAAVESDGAWVPNAVMPHDLSATGIRGKWDMALPEGHDFPLELELSAPVRLQARVAWQRVLPRGRALAGLTFAQPSAEVERYLASLSGASRRGEERQEAVLPIEMIVEGGESSVPALATNLSRSGLQIANDFRLPDEGRVLLLLGLDWSAPLEVAAEVRWQQPTMFEGFDVGLAFVDPSPAVREALDRYLSPA